MICICTNALQHELGKNLYVQVYFHAGEYRNFIALPTQGLATNEGNFLYLTNSSAGVVSFLLRRRRKVLDKVSKV